MLLSQMTLIAALMLTQVYGAAAPLGHGVPHRFDSGATGRLLRAGAAKPIQWTDGDAAKRVCARSER